MRTLSNKFEDVLGARRSMLECAPKGDMGSDDVNGRSRISKCMYASTELLKVSELLGRMILENLRGGFKLGAVSSTELASPDPSSLDVLWIRAEWMSVLFRE